MNGIASDLRALVYLDEGVCAQSAAAITEQLEAVLDPEISVQTVDSAYLIERSWEDDTAVLAMGGGVCSIWEASLGKKGMQKIHNYVFRGGKYIGLCAGACFAVAESNYQVIGASAIKKKRALSFFPRMAIGPMIPSDAPLSSAAARAAQVAFKIGGKMHSGYLYYQGGSYFDIDKDTDETEIFAKYERPFQRPAVAIRCSVGEGRAFLCGMHPEFAWPQKLKKVSDRTFGALAHTLCPQEPFRQKVWHEIGSTLNLPMKKKVSDESVAEAPLESFVDSF